MYNSPPGGVWAPSTYTLRELGMELQGAGMNAHEAAIHNERVDSIASEFGRLVLSRGLTDCYPYMAGLVTKLNQFTYHVELLTEAAREHVMEVGAESLNGENAHGAVFKMEAQVEAAMHAAYSAVDMLGQVVNFLVLEIRVAEDFASLGSVIKALKKASGARDTYRAVKALDNCAEFGYFYAFANTSKHRRPVSTTVEIKERNAVRARLEVYIQEVQGRKGDFPSRPFSQVVLKTEPELRRRIVDVLYEVNAHLASLPESPTVSVASP